MKLFNMPLKTFDPQTLLEEMLASESNTVFVLGQETKINPEGDDTIELVIATIQRVKDEPND